MLDTIDYQTLPVPASVNVRKLYGELGAVAGMGAQPDDLGNMQGVYRLDAAASGAGYVLTFPLLAKSRDVQAVITAHNPAEPAPAPTRLAVARASIVADATLPEPTRLALLKVVDAVS